MSFKLSEREIKVAMVSAFVTIFVSVGMLEYKGYIKHSSPADTSIIDEFKLLSLNPDATQKMSPKSSGKQAFCSDGYLLVRPTNNQSVAGVLVDGKNRGIICTTK
jgi:hypothetical protein